MPEDYRVFNQWMLLVMSHDSKTWPLTVSLLEKLREEHRAMKRAIYWGVQLCDLIWNRQSPALISDTILFLRPVGRIRYLVCSAVVDNNAVDCTEICRTTKFIARATSFHEELTIEGEGFSNRKKRWQGSHHVN